LCCSAPGAPEGGTVLSQDRELLARVHKVNQAAGTITLAVLSVIADDAALGAAFAELGGLYKQLGEAFIERAADLKELDI
jgi:hypothetical protein